MGTCCELSHGMPFAFSGKKLLPCTQPWSGRETGCCCIHTERVFSIDPQLDESLAALGFRVPDSLGRLFYT